MMPVMGVLVFWDSKHAVGVCLGTIPTRTDVQLGPLSLLPTNVAESPVQVTFHDPGMSTITRRTSETNVRIMLDTFDLVPTLTSSDVVAALERSLFLLLDNKLGVIYRSFAFLNQSQFA